MLLSGLICLVLITGLLFLLKSGSTQRKKLPPSPFALPIIGHLHLMNPRVVPLHRTLQSLSNKYGPIMSLRFGSRNVVVVSSPRIAEECLTKNEANLANRPKLTPTKYIGYNFSTIIASPYGDHYINLRRICNVEVFSNSRINASSGIRRGYIEKWVRDIYNSCVSSSSVDGNGYSMVELRPICFKLAFHMGLLFVSGRTYSTAEEREFRSCLKAVGQASSVTYPGDFLPFFNYFDFQGYVNQVKQVASRMDRVVEALIHRAHERSSEDSMIGHLLALRELEPQYYTADVIKGLVSDLLIAGTHTIDTTTEWAMANLLNHPEILMKAKKELDAEVGQDHLIEESDIHKLPYLQSIICETLRLHPPNPLLIPRESSGECIIGGYNIPGNTMFFINAWAIHRDPNVWNDELSFKPERFLNKKSQTEDFKFIPFGYGRRSCPALTIANRILVQSIGAMVQCFEWKRSGNEYIDMTEAASITLPKAKKLVGMCKPRNIMNTLQLSSV